MTKVIIELPNNMQGVCQWHKDGICALTNVEVNMIAEAIVNGKQLPDNATNGDVIQALFDGTVLMTNSMGVGYRLNPPKEGRYMPWFDKNWWNTPYKAGDTYGTEIHN